MARKINYEENHRSKDWEDAQWIKALKSQLGELKAKKAEGD